MIKSLKMIHRITVEPQYTDHFGPEGVQYTEKFGILKVILNDTLVKVQQVQLVHA